MIIIDFMLESKLGTGSTEYNPEYGTPGKDGRDLCYNRNIAGPKDYANYFLLSGCANGARGLLFEKAAGMVAKGEWIDMNRSGEFLNVYLNGASQVVITSEQMEEIITTHTNNLYHYMINFNSLIELCEDALPNNATMIFASNNEDNFKIACYTDKQDKCMNHFFDVNRSDAITTDVGEDWSYALGDSYCGLICSASRSGEKYSMTYKIYLMDYYEWGYHVDGGDEDLHMLHECGLAKEYPIYGVLENTITWERGYRIVEPNEVKEIVATSVSGG